MPKPHPDVLRFLNHIGHWNAGVVIDRAGSLYAAIQINGIPSDLFSDAAIVAARDQDNALLMGVAGPRLEWWEHYCSLDGQPMPGLPPIQNWFGGRFDTAYRAAQGSHSFNAQRLYLTLVWHPGDGVRRALRALWGADSSEFPEAGDRDLRQFEDIVGRVVAGLSRRYGAQRLKLDGERHSAIGAAWYAAMNNRLGRVPLTRNALGPSIVRNRVVFGYRGGDVPEGVFEISGSGPRQYGAILSFLRPPQDGTWPKMLDGLRAQQIPMTITNSGLMGQRSKSVKALTDQQGRMEVAADPSVKQRALLGEEAEKIQEGQAVTVNHHCTVAVFAPDPATLEARASSVQSDLSDVGIIAIRETTALKAAYYAQLPGNARHRPRPARVNSSNMLALAAKHAVPTGQETSRWGAPLIYFKSTAGTAVPFHWHCKPTPQTPKGDLGNTLFIGRSGSGKTSLLGSLALMTLRVPRSRTVIVDRDFGLSTMVRAAGYPYLVLRAGEASGMAPLRRLTNSPSDLAFLRSWVRGLILSDDRGEIDEDEGAWLASAVEREMGKPAAQRGLRNIGAVLGVRNRHGAAARLRPWCRGEELGWAYDGEVDGLEPAARMFGVDTTAILGNPLLSGPGMAYLFHVANGMTNGDPLLLVVDEMWAADQVGAFRDQNNAWLKTGRKREIVLALATQSAHDVLHSQIAHSFRQQVPRRVYFGEEAGEGKATRSDLMDGMGLTEAEYRVVTETLPNMPFAFLVQQPGGGYVARYDLSGMPGMIPAISGRDTTYELANELIAKHGSDPLRWVPEFERLAPGIVDTPTLARAA